ncbi:alpha/beta hydrolase family esterase [Actinomycetota bacterium Odt1-20B]
MPAELRRRRRLRAALLAAVLAAVLAGLTGAAGTAPAGAAPAGPKPEPEQGSAGVVVDRPVRTTGCRTASPYTPGTSTVAHLNSGGSKRSYLIHVPADYNPRRATPVVLSFHGHKRTSAYQERLTGMSGLPAIAVYPQGVTGTDSESAWQGAPYSAPVDDVLFTSDLISLLQRQLCVDARRVYVTGKSNGGGFVGVLACRMPGRIAAFAPVSGAFYPQGGACEPDRPAPVIEFHGTADTTIPYEGVPAKGLPPLPSWLADWARRDGCRPAPTSRDLGDGVTRQRWHGCDGRSDLVHYRMGGLGHDWPSTVPNEDSDTPAALDATPLIWRFFREHRLSA